jgi:hypothetical protein
MHGLSGLDGQSRASVRLPLCDETQIDASEYLNAVYEDFSQI